MRISSACFYKLYEDTIHIAVLHSPAAHSLDLLLHFCPFRRCLQIVPLCQGGLWIHEMTRYQSKATASPAAHHFASATRSPCKVRDSISCILSPSGTLDDFGIRIRSESLLPLLPISLILRFVFFQNAFTLWLRHLIQPLLHHGLFIGLQLLHILISCRCDVGVQVYPSLRAVPA